MRGEPPRLRGRAGRSPGRRPPDESGRRSDRSCARRGWARTRTRGPGSLDAPRRGRSPPPPPQLRSRRPGDVFEAQVRSTNRSFRHLHPFRPVHRGSRVVRGSGLLGAIGVAAPRRDLYPRRSRGAAEDPSGHTRSPGLQCSRPRGPWGPPSTNVAELRR